MSAWPAFVFVLLPAAILALWLWWNDDMRDRPRPWKRGRR